MNDLNNIKSMVANTTRSKEKKGFMLCVVLQVLLGKQIMRLTF